jgi:glycine oxidase
VLLLGRDDAPGAATPAAAGMLAPQIEARAGDPTLDLGIAARDRYTDLAAELLAHGHDIGFQPGGILHVAFDDAGAIALEAQAAAQQNLGLEAVWWDQLTVHQEVPGIGESVTGGLFAPRDASVDSVALLAALLADAAAAGAEVRPRTDADRLLVRQGRVTGVRHADGESAAPWAVVAAGAWSPQMHGLPRPLPVVPVRGQMALAPWPGGERRLVVFGPDGYIVPRGGHALLGSTMEQVGFEPVTTADGIAHIRTTTGRILPPLLTYPILRTWAGLRPITPDGRPILGHDPEIEGLLYCTGHGRNGILLGPLSGEIVRDLVVHGGSSRDLAPYAVGRFTATEGVG